jgi:hypothetical protein
MADTREKKEEVEEKQQPEVENNGLDDKDLEKAAGGFNHL